MHTQVFPILDSTQEEARRQLVQHQFTKPKMIIAEEQTNGYGRFKRSFYSPKRGLYLTMIVPGDVVRCTSTLVTHATAIGLVSVLTNAGYQGVGIKWINDLYVQMQKVAGILVEQMVIDDRAYYLVGIGLNINAQEIPTELNYKMGTLNTDMESFDDPMALVSAIQETLLTVYALSNDVILSYYRQSCLMIGRWIEAEVGHDTLSGRVLDINQSGGLVLSTNAGDIHINTGEVIRLKM